MVRNVIKQVLKNNDNNAYLVGEEQFITWTTTMGMNGMGSSQTPIYHFNSIAVTKFNSEGILLSNELVRKYQVSTGRKNDIYSYYAFLNNGRLNLFFNAESLDEKRSETSLTFKTKRESKLALYNVQMDDNGDMVYKEIIESGKN